MKKRYFQTSDFPLAVTLSIWFPIGRLDKTNQKRAVFYFAYTSELDQLVNEYNRSALRVNPAEFYQASRLIKSRLYQN